MSHCLFIYLFIEAVIEFKQYSQDISCYITDTLGNATVLVLRLHNLYGIVFQEEVDLTLSDSVRLRLSLRYSLLEVCIKTQNLEGQSDILWLKLLK